MTDSDVATFTYTVETSGGEEEVTGTTATLVTAASELAVGDQIVIVASGYDVALSTTQNNNNRAEAAVTKDAETNTVTFGEDVQVLTLEEGTSEGTFAFQTGSGYLYAASSSSNYLRTEETLSANSSWEISIATGSATVKAQGGNSRNWLRYNSGNKIFSCYVSGQQDISIYKLSAEPAMPTRMATAPEHLDKVYIYHPGSGMVLTGEASGAKLAGTDGTVAGDLLTVTEGMLELVVSVDTETGYYSFITAEGKYLTSGATGNSLTLTDAASNYSLWTLAADGVGYVINNVNAKYGTNVQAVEYYSGFTTYGTKTGNAAYIMQFFKSGEATELPGGGSEEPEKPETITGTLTDALTHGDQVVIFYGNDNNLVMTGTASGAKLTGVAGTVEDSTLTTTTEAAVFTVYVDVDGNLSFVTADGKYLTSGATGSSLSLADAASDYSLWTLESVEGGFFIKNVNAKYGSNAQYIEYYKGFTTYGMNESSAAIYTYQFYKTGHVENLPREYKTDSSVVESIAAWGGGGPYDEGVISVNGDRYTVGDMRDENAVFTAVVNGAAVKPFTTGTSTSTGVTSYYMGGTGLGSGSNDYLQLAVSTAGWGDMELSFRLRASNTGPGEFQLQYSTDGSNFVNFTTGSYAYSYTQYSSDGTSTPVSKSGDITDGVAKTSLKAATYIQFTFAVPSGAENAEHLYIRLVPGTTRANGAEGTPSTGGTIRMDTVILSGSPIVDGSITGYVTVEPDGVEEDQAPGTELTMTCATEGATILYRFNGGAWQTYSETDKPVLPETLPANLEVKATSEGRADSITRIFTYAAGTVSAVKMSPNGGGVYLAGDSDTVEVTLSCDTEGATIYYNTGAQTDGVDAYTVYDPANPIVLSKGFGSLTVKAYAEKAGFTTSAVTTRTFTERSQASYNIYFGQMHSHTNYSDGAGSAEDAFSHASKVDNLDFLAVTDHSNSFDNADSASISDGSMSTEWVEGHELAQKYTTEDFVCLFGFEMTWSNGLGHINTFNTDGFQSRTQTAYSTYSTALQNYYDTLKTVSDSLSQFNHPGTTFGDFSDFAHYDEEIDDLITLIEVGNGEGAIGSSGYFPSYEYYTRALDKGWHVAPSNNQDNHKGNWGDANTGRTVVLADELTEEAIYDAVRNYRVYATEDSDLSIYYTMDGNIMGSILSKSDVDDVVNLTVKLSDPTDASIGKVEVIVNGGLSVASQTVTGKEGTVTFSIGADYSYYYIKVTEPDGDIAVTAPVWVGEVEAVGISAFTTDAALAVQNQPLNLTLDLYNNEKSSFEIESIVFTIDDAPIHTADLTGLAKVKPMGTASYTFSYAYDGLGTTKIYATVTGTLNGVTKVYQEVLSLSFVSPEMVTRVLIDGTHYNDYVTGYYGGNMGNFTAIAADKSVEVTVVTDKITADMLKDCALLVISAPARKAGTANAGDYTASTFEASFIALVADYVRSGGSVAVCGLADYQDKSAVNGAAGHAAAQINKLLAAIGSTMSINDDEVYDAVNNGGQFYRLYPSVFNTDSPWTDGIVEGQVYSQYSGCSVNAGEGTWLVRGFDTTYSVDSDKDGVGNTDEIETDDDYGYNVVTPKGEVVFLACEETAYGGTIFAAGGVFLSDFEVKAELDNIWDLPYANRTIAENILDAVRVELPLSTIAEVRAADMGEVFRIRGYATAGRMEGNAFFDAMYLQDKTGGTTVFPIAEDGNIDIGTPMEIVGYVDAYQGDKEIQVMSYKILDEEPYVWTPEEMSCADAMDYENNGGKLIQVRGTVKAGSIAYNSDGTLAQFVVVDAAGGEAKVFIDGYILSATTGKNEIAGWLKEGQTVSAVGLLYMHPEGSSDVSVPVLRVRNCDEIKKLDDTTPITPSKPSGSTSATPSESKLPFRDVSKTAWYYDDVKYVYEKGIMQGTGAYEFSPEMYLTRGMIVTILYRLENEPSVRFQSTFSDVKDGLWYSDSVEWAAKNGIVNGYDNGGFGPTDPITREQLATILYRYAKYKGYDVSVGENTNILSYTDAFDVSEYAIPAMQWACGAGLINGADGRLMPKASASRAQVAAIIHRFLEP